MKYLIVLLALPFLSYCSSPRPSDLGIKTAEGKDFLKKCPESPNCINSHFPEDKDHYLEPLKYETTKEQAKNLVIQILNKTPNAVVVANDNDYIHAEFTSSIFRFVDDVEFNFKDQGLIHFRSASRLGHSDLGANRKRMSQLSFRFYQNDM